MITLLRFDSLNPKQEGEEAGCCLVGRDGTLFFGCSFCGKWAAVLSKPGISDVLKVTAGAVSQQDS